MNKQLILAGITLACFAAAGMVVGNTIPTTRTITEVRKIEYQQADSIKPIENVSDICAGKVPVVVINSTVAKNETAMLTYVTVHLPGSKVQLFCNKSGDYTGEWVKDAIIQIPNGQPD